VNVRFAAGVPSSCHLAAEDNNWQDDDYGRL